VCAKRWAFSFSPLARTPITPRDLCASWPPRAEGLAAAVVAGVAGDVAGVAGDGVAGAGVAGDVPAEAPRLTAVPLVPVASGPAAALA